MKRKFLKEKEIILFQSLIHNFCTFILNISIIRSIIKKLSYTTVVTFRLLQVLKHS